MIIDLLVQKLNDFGFYLKKNRNQVLEFSKKRTYPEPMNSRYQGIGILKELNIDLKFESDYINIVCRPSLEYLIFCSFMIGFMLALMHHFITEYHFSAVFGLVVGIVTYLFGRWYIKNKMSLILKDFN